MLDRDHRKLGKRLGLFHFQEQAPGMAFWHPRGLSIVREIEAAVRRVIAADGYREVRSPQLLGRQIWQASGHWQHFRDGMFVLADESAALKPVSCPGHIQIVDRMLPSQRDLPIRLAELGLVHRAEQSGNLHGLFRLRQFCQDDGHVFCRDDQVESELRRFLLRLLEFYAAFGIDDFSIALSGRPALRAGDDAVWDRAERLLAEAARDAGMHCLEQPGQGAFYGPKLELLVRDHAGREWQSGTLQLDFFSAERFGLRYEDAGGGWRHPVMLHRALCGSIERFVGLLLERHGARLPAWLAPEQVAVLPVSDAVREHAAGAAAELERRGIRALIDPRSERIGRRIRDAHERGVPVIGVVGAREVRERSISLAEPGSPARSLPLSDAAAWLVERFAPPC